MTHLCRKPPGRHFRHRRRIVLVRHHAVPAVRIGAVSSQRHANVIGGGMVRSGWIALAVVGAALAGTPARAAETCHAFGGRFAKERICVSSVLASQAGSTYGPDHLMGTGDGAWCEGVPGPGIGQSVTI